MSNIYNIKILKHNPPPCRKCKYPSKNDKERVLVKINSDNSGLIYAVKCPNVITPEGTGCINDKFLFEGNISRIKSSKELVKGEGEIAVALPTVIVERTIAVTLPKEKLESLYYEQNRSLQDIASEFNCSKRTVMLLMNKYKIEMRSKSKARLLAIKEGKFEDYTHDDINVDFFSEWSPEMAWVLGLLFTDGNVGRGRITITSIDFDLLEKVQKLLNSTRSIKKHQQTYDKTKHIYTFEFYQEKMRKQLELLGLTERKSLTMKFPDIPKEYMRHFVRGWWDGDGSFFLNDGKIRASFVSGSKEFMEKLVEELYSEGFFRTRLIAMSAIEQESFRLKFPPYQYPLKIHIDKRTKNNSYSIKIDSINNLDKLFYYFYQDVAESIYLKRKYDVLKTRLLESKLSCLSLYPDFL